MPSQLHFHVHVADPVLEHGTPPVPHGYPPVASPLTSTLIVGDHEALLVDPPWAKSQLPEFATWVESFGKRLTGIYITHGHGDHWFGAPELLKKFPEATVFATSGTARYIVEQHATRIPTWDVRFPGEVAEGELVPQIADELGFDFEGHRLLPVELGHTDTDDTTGLWVPSLRLFVAGDSVYNHCHQYLNESADGGLAAWYEALDIVDALEPEFVVAGHKDKTQPDDAEAVRRTREYLDVFTELASSGTYTEEGLFDKMMEIYPKYANPKALWRSVVAVLSAQSSASV